MTTDELYESIDDYINDLYALTLVNDTLTCEDVDQLYVDIGNYTHHWISYTHPANCLCCLLKRGAI